MKGHEDRRGICAVQNFVVAAQLLGMKATTLASRIAALGLKAKTAS